MLQARKRDVWSNRGRPKPCGPDAPTLASSWRSNPSAMVARKPGHQGEHGVSRKPLRREGRTASASPVCSCAHFLCINAHETAGAARTRSSLRPFLRVALRPLYEGANEFADLGQIMSRERETIFSRHRPARPGDPVFQSACDERKRSGILDHPLSRVMTAQVVGQVDIPHSRLARLRVGNPRRLCHNIGQTTCCACEIESGPPAANKSGRT